MCIVNKPVQREDFHLLVVLAVSGESIQRDRLVLVDVDARAQHARSLLLHTQTLEHSQHWQLVSGQGVVQKVRELVFARGRRARVASALAQLSGSDRLRNRGQLVQILQVKATRIQSTSLSVEPADEWRWWWWWS